MDAILRAKAQALQPASQESYHKVQGWYREALKIEPDNVAAQFGLASWLAGETATFSSTVSAAQRDSAIKEAKDLATRALQREPDSSRGLGILWGIAWESHDCPELARVATALLALAPNGASANAHEFADGLVGLSETRVGLLLRHFGGAALFPFL